MAIARPQFQLVRAIRYMGDCNENKRKHKRHVAQKAKAVRFKISQSKKSEINLRQNN
jgi:hypothetical protein